MVRRMLAVVWVVVGAAVGAAIGMVVGAVAGAAVSALLENGTPRHDATAYLVGAVVAVGCMVIGAIAGGAGAIVWAIDNRGTSGDLSQKAHRFGDQPDDFR